MTLLGIRRSSAQATWGETFVLGVLGVSAITRRTPCGVTVALSWPRTGWRRKQVINVRIKLPAVEGLGSCSRNLQR